MPYKQVSIITKKWKNQKPPIGSQIDWSHPLSKGLVGCWLMNEGGGKIVKNLTGRNSGTLYNSAKFSPTLKGTGLSFNTTTNDAIVILDDQSQRVTSITLVILYYVDSATLANFDRLFEKEYANAVDPPYVSWGFEWQRSPDQVKFFAARTNNTDLNNLTYGNNNLYNRYAFLIGVYNENKGYEIYLDGKLVASDYTKTGAISWYSSTGNQIEGFAYNFGSSNSASGKLVFAYLYNRALSPSETQQLYQDPYCFIQPTRRRFYFQTGEAPAANKPTRRRVILSCN